MQLNSNTLRARNIKIVDQTNVNHISSSRDPTGILHEHVAFGALHDSSERFNPPKCHPQTRTAVLDCIDKWVRDVSDNAKPILWLNGAAGAGKSAIAQSIAESWIEQGIITITFFFWRTSSERNQKSRLIPTLAFQLSERFPSIKTRIESAFDSGALFKRNLASQLEKLVIQPLQYVQEQRPIVIVIDGLDECCMDLPKVKDLEGQNHESQQQEILEGVAFACQKAPSLRFLIVSRPERQIRESFGEGFLKGFTLPVCLTSAPDAHADIELFLECRLEEIRQRHHIDPSWPSKDQISKLVEKSSGQFIYPSVALKHISRPRANPVASLKGVLELRPGSTDKPLAELDILYSLVLKSVAVESLPVVTDILGTILTDGQGLVASMFRPQPGYTSPHLFEKLFFLTQGDVYSHLTDLHSVLHIPSDPNKSIRFIHGTFSEYLQDKSRSDDFFIDKKSIYGRWALFSFRHIRERLQLNDDICSSESKFRPYDPTLFQNSIQWIWNCPPSKELMDAVWSMVHIDIGPCPSWYIDSKSVFHNHRGPKTNPTAQRGMISLSRLMEQWKWYGRANDLYQADMLGVIVKLIYYIQTVNIPEIESSRWQRYVIHYHLEFALLRIYMFESNAGISNPVRILIGTKISVLWLLGWFTSGTVVQRGVSDKMEITPSTPVMRIWRMMIRGLAIYLLFYSLSYLVF